MSDHLSWTSYLLRAFYAEGISHIYLSPGSRSTPLVMAAAVHPGFEKHVVLDERSAAFQALGAAKSTGIPALLICTSGTALAHYHPAVIEARHSGVPIIILSADRPPYLRGTGSSQTIDQIKIYGDSVVMFHEAGEPVHRTEDYRRLNLLAKQSVTAAISEAGPVHINLPFRKPLEPTTESLEKEVSNNKNQVSHQKDRKSNFHMLVTAAPGREVIEAMNNSRRPLIIAGPDEHWRSLKQITDSLTSKLNAPLIAEPGSHLNSSINFIDRYDLLLNSDFLRKSIKPDLIIRIGDKPFSKSLHVLESETKDIPAIQLVSRHNCQNSFGTEDYRIVMRDSEFKPENLKQKKNGWIDKWLALNDRAEKILNDAIQQTSALTDGHVYHFFSKFFTKSWNVMSSNSFTIRDLALFSPRSSGISGSYVNRGAAGIDGVLSTGLGISHSTRKQTAVFIGDLALLHDSNALLSLKDPEQTVVIIVINNNGGNIFRMLPVYRQAKYYTRYFETPQKTDLAYLAKAHDIPYLLINSKQKLLNTSISGLKTHSNLLIECITDPDKSMELRNFLWNSKLQVI